MCTHWLCQSIDYIYINLYFLNIYLTFFNHFLDEVKPYADVLGSIMEFLVNNKVNSTLVVKV